MPSLHYAVSMPDPRTHYFDVTLETRGLGRAQVDLKMPAWTPGSYKIRDYARNVEAFDAGDRAWRKVDKQTWRVEASGVDVRVSYRVYAFELNVRGLHLDEDHGYFNGAGMFLYVDGSTDLPCTLEVRPPKGWSVVTGLGLTGRVFTAPTYDVLVDSPVECGRPDLVTWRSAGKLHRAAIHGRGIAEPRRLAADLKKITDAATSMFGGAPYDHYTFLIHTTQDGGGGLEHLNSASIQVQPSTFRPRARYLRFLELMSHEFFHLWNVKRIHPAALGPFDYSKEVHTTLLWAMEGVTSYYESLLLRRAGLVTAAEYLKSLSGKIEAFRDKPGRLRQSLADSSWEAWTKFYAPTEQTPNSQVSYYEKGALAGLLLDLEIRSRTKNRRSLDDAMLRLWKEHGKRGRGFPEAEFRIDCERASGLDLGAFWREIVDGRGEIDWAGRLKAAGLALVHAPRKEDDKPLPRDRAFLGVVGGRAGDRVLVTSVRSGSPAEKAGLCAKDEILAVDGLRVDAETWTARLDETKPGQTIALDFLRDGARRRATARLAAKENMTVTVERVKKPTALQKAVYEGWLKAKWEVKPAAKAGPAGR